MGTYVINVKTDKFLGDEAFVQKLLAAWCDKLDPSLRPEFFDLGEPVRSSFAEGGIDLAVQKWVSNRMGLMLKRRNKPTFLAEIDWFDRQRGLDPRLFPWSCSVWLDSAAGDELALKLLSFLIKHFEPAFGFVATESDFRSKHFLTFEDRTGTTEMYIGTDILEEDKKLPGVYWATYFGPWAVREIGIEKFAVLRAERVEIEDSGYLVIAYNSSTDAESPNACKALQNIKKQLGNRFFFDKAKIDIEALKDEPEEAEIIEEKIRKLKKT